MQKQKCRHVERMQHETNRPELQTQNSAKCGASEDKMASETGSAIYEVKPMMMMILLLFIYNYMSCPLQMKRKDFTDVISIEEYTWNCNSTMTLWAECKVNEDMEYKFYTHVRARDCLLAFRFS